MQDTGTGPNDTIPNGEELLKEIIKTRRELSTRLDRIEATLLETRADLRDVEDRLDKIERNRFNKLTAAPPSTPSPSSSFP